MFYDNMKLKRNGKVPLYQQLYDQIKQATANGALRPGQKLPSIRVLCEDLSLSRTTVEAAYQQLCVEGYLKAKPQSGYYVLAAGGQKPVKPPILSDTPSAPFYRYNFGAESVDSDCADLKAWRRHIRDHLNRQEVLIRYGEHQGELPLREALRDYTYEARGVICNTEQIVIGAGTQPLLYLLCGLLQGKVGAVSMESPGFLQAEQVFSDCGIGVIKLSADKNGPKISDLYESSVRLLYVTPSSRPQSGEPIPLLRRQELLQWAKETDGLIIEDDYNGELRYRARPIGAMQGMGNGGKVIYLGSFSKLLLPSVRISYMVLPSALLPTYLERVGRYNQTASRIEQLALSDYIKSGQMQRHLRRLRNVYAQKSELLQQSLKTQFEDFVDISLQEIPLYAVIRLKNAPSVPRLVELAAAESVRVLPGQNGTILLSFAGIPQEEIVPAVKALGRAWNKILYK